MSTEAMKLALDALEHSTTFTDGSVFEQKKQERLDAMAALRQAIAQPEACTWTQTDDEDGIWSSSCGELWSFIDGGPKENRVSYCHHCGKKVEVKP